MEQYISKSAVVAEIDKLKGKVDDGSSYCNGWQHALRMLEIEINTLEVKEVELEKELESWRHNHFHGRRDKEASGEYLERVSQLELVKHFFELGLAKKGE